MVIFCAEKLIDNPKLNGNKARAAICLHICARNEGDDDDDDDDDSGIAPAA